MKNINPQSPSPYKLKDSNLNYDTQQYQELMKNFENLIKVTQDKLYSNQKKIEETCKCSIEDQYQALLIENDNLKQLLQELQLKLEQDNSDVRPLEQQQQFESFMKEAVLKSEQQNELIERLQQQTLEFQQQLLIEKGQHCQTQKQLSDIQEEFHNYKKERTLQQCYDFEVTEKITQGYSELVKENQKQKQELKELQQEIDKLRIALNQAYISLSKQQQQQHKLPLRITNQDELQTTGTQTETIIYQQHEILKERINNQMYNLEKFISQYLDKKKMRNKSANENKFYTDLSCWVEQAKFELISLKQQITALVTEKEHQKEQLIAVKQDFEQAQNSLTQETQVLKSEIKNQNEKYQILLEDFNKAQIKYTEIAEEKKLISNVRIQLESELNQLKSQYEQLQFESNSYDTQFKIITQSYQSDKKLYEDQLEKQQQKNLSLESELSQSLLQKEQIINQLGLANNNIQQLQQQLKEAQEKANHSSEHFEQTQEKITFIIKEKEQLMKSNLELEQNQQILKENINKLKEQQSKLEKERQNNQNLVYEMEKEKEDLKIYCQKLQQDLTERNVQLTSLKEQLSNMEYQLYLTPSDDKSRIENTYMSSKIEDLESILKEKDQKIEDLERLYHLTNYELRILQDYSSTFERDLEFYKTKVQKLEQELIEQQNVLSISKASVNSNIPTNKFDEQARMNSSPISSLKIDSQTTNGSPQIQVKILSGEIQRLSQIVKIQQKKLLDLQYFIEKMITSNEQNRLLAKQILLQASQCGEINGYNLFEKVNLNTQIGVNSCETFGINVQSIEKHEF
ncbi:unnamed protein product (macronuclear) [Paramecium tetraurelia]|uniref:GRIP domain-containing protein n=1 Tax=Paramecium tetraurelia TaxID=5888 RepID=A0DWX7_PARTE|nr:uncharacterized protein GSPATT00021187001 [Paramecium tetraurelia]CAK87544.1 unnamed protein product [Paramecium tetraurelia]|eukprot:XP_001454941.1 hypothetical protein (macronuclear) [Paramecium tetraurelia strain d4-2]